MTTWRAWGRRHDDAHGSIGEAIWLPDGAKPENIDIENWFRLPQLDLLQGPQPLDCDATIENSADRPEEDFCDFCGHEARFHRTSEYKGGECQGGFPRDCTCENTAEDVRGLGRHSPLREAFDRIAQIASDGAGDWEYPWQVVRDVERLRDERKKEVQDERPIPDEPDQEVREAALDRIAEIVGRKADWEYPWQVARDVVRLKAELDCRKAARPTGKDASPIVKQTARDADALTAVIGDLATGKPADDSSLNTLSDIAERIDARSSTIHELITDLDECRAIRDQRWEKAKRAEEKQYEAERQLGKVREELRSTRETLAEESQGAGAATAERDNAYAQRNIAAVTLARMALRAGCKAGLMIDREAEHGWRHVVAVDLPTGQVTWHLPDHHAQWGGSLPRYEGTWDGHATVEKNRRCLAFASTAFAPETSEGDLIELLAKLDSGEGGRRTGELKRRGWLRWEVTKEGKEALGTRAQPARFVRTAAEIDAAASMSRHGRAGRVRIIDETPPLPCPHCGTTLTRVTRAGKGGATEYSLEPMMGGPRSEAARLRRGIEDVANALEAQVHDIVDESGADPLDIATDLRSLLDRVDPSEGVEFLDELKSKYAERMERSRRQAKALDAVKAQLEKHDASVIELVEQVLNGNAERAAGQAGVLALAIKQPGEMVAFRKELSLGKYTRWASDYTADQMAAIFWLVGEMRARLVPQDFFPLYEYAQGGVRRSVVAAATLADSRIDQPPMGLERVRLLMRAAVSRAAWVDPEKGLVLPEE